MNPIIEAKNINKSFSGVHALKDVSVTIEEGEILCLVGENGCGKSTLVKILSGVYEPDSGEINLLGNTYSKLTPREAIDNGIQVIFQDLSLFPHLSVAENICIQHVASGKKTVDWDAIYRIAAEQLAKINVSLDLSAHVDGLSVANKQIVAICRALSMEAKVLFMDEPTTALTKNEINTLLEIAQHLSKQGVSIIFISHKLDEVFEIADRITVIRDGFKVGDFDPADLDEEKLAYHMTGREIGFKKYKRSPGHPDKPVLQVQNLSRNNMYHDLSFDLRKGDILGVIGSLGSGRTEFALSLFGLNRPHSGHVQLNGNKLPMKTPRESINRGIALVPEDRLSQGLYLNKSIRTNISSGILKRLTKSLNFIDRKKEKQLAEEKVNQIKVNTNNIELLTRNLSGGNQQKVVLGKWLASEPDVLILDSPTVGVDIGSKAEIYELIQKEAERGMALILISDDATEIISNCNRALVIRDGEIAEVLEEKELRDPDIATKINQIIYREEQGKYHGKK